jgi:hypothetical protein
MDGESFDVVARRASATASRRGVLRAGASALAGLALSLVSLSGREAAAGKQRKKRRPKRCGAGGPCRVFVSSTVYGGNLGGLVGADAICQQLAEDANLPGSYKAWLSDSAASPSTRFVQSTGPYRLVNGTRIARNWTDLTDESLDVPINRTQSGNAVADSATVWTFTKGNGTAIDANADNCGNWSSAAGNGDVGAHAFRDSRWTDNGAQACNTGQHLYCFQQS